VLDTARGRPASGIAVELSFLDAGQWLSIAVATTDADGRVRDWAASSGLRAGTYRVRFETEHYLLTHAAGFYPYVDVVFSVELDEHYHIPLLLSPYGYSTYRGS
jgi:5-hydroxyisourate hydrolase